MARTFIALVLAGTALGAAADQQQLKAGNWQLTVKISVPNLPVQMPETTNVRCLTEADVRNPQSMTPTDAMGGRSEQCKVTNMKTVGNKTSWDIDCAGAGTGKAEVEYVNAENFKSTVTSTIGAQTMTMNITGKYTGACQRP